MIRAIVYNGRDNTIDLQLTEEGAGHSLSAVMRMVLKGDTVTVDSAAHPTAFDWTTDPGKLVLALGGAGLATGTYLMQLVIYSADYPDGLVWGDEFMRIKVVDI